ncbi:MAG TPA: rhomboid family intramembrane serine protease [Capillimicrobium sp.]|nr:rhomboid family intramembrane serine protease [Capillimicrobium sp.]
MATCYRHPDRETGVSCSNCGNPICTDCMTPTPVGMRCPECARQRTKVRTAAAVRTGSTAAPVTKALIAVNVAAYLGELATGTGGLNGVGGSFVNEGALLGHGIVDGHPAGVEAGEYWRLITGGFLHASIIHIAFNMYILWFLGNLLEPAIGSVRLALLYFTALLAGSFGALLLEPNGFTVGASGAVFGLMGAAFFESRTRGVEALQSQIGLLIVFNLVLSFVLNNISVGGHIGGLIGGSLAALALQYGDRLRQPWLGAAGCVLIAAVSVVAAIAVADRVVT